MARNQRKSKDATEGSDSAALHKLVLGFMRYEGRGGLTKVASLSGMKVSATRKRLADPRRFLDEPTMRLVLWLTGSRTDHAPVNGTPTKPPMSFDGITWEEIDGKTYWSPTK